MLSSFKLALFALVAFAALVLASPTAETRGSTDVKGLFTDTNNQLKGVFASWGSGTVTPAVFTAGVSQASTIVRTLTVNLKGASLDGCGCGSDILGLVAELLLIILGPINTACGYNSGLLGLVGGLIALLVELIEVVLALVGVLVVELVVLLLGNGCLTIILGLSVSVVGPLLSCLGLAL
ncbi:hypothetical protein BC834DRAFT_970911 [Gloeopeniophorella convolvens]|nr:hypothetical protein BC834DRAFT_970911 [Gloeopeniophorella convolvens]